jgi:hypothetical protein
MAKQTPAQMNDMMNAEDMVDLGKVSPGNPAAPGDVAESGDTPDVSYPSVHLTLDEPLDLPPGEFSFVAVGRLAQEGVNHKTDTGQYTYDLEIMALKATGAVAAADEAKAERGMVQVDSADDLERKLIGKGAGE